MSTPTLSHEELTDRILDMLVEIADDDEVREHLDDDLFEYGYLGSSEFYISKNLVAQCPQAVFGESNCGIDLTYIGEAYDQSLWQTIAAGAYASRTKRRQCMVFLSPQWFFRGC